MLKTYDNIELFLLLGTLMALSLISFIILIVILYRRAQLKNIVQRQNFEQDLLQTEVEIQEQTLQNISRDLHDNFGQIASLIKINLNLLSKELSERDQQRISESKELLSKLIGDIRFLSTSLASENLEKSGLAQKIESDLERVKRTGAIAIEYENSLNDTYLKSEEKVFLYRIFQEILNNALKHSQASKFIINLSGRNRNFTLIFSDNGIGFDTEAQHQSVNKNGGNGLENIKNRCKKMGARITIDSQQGVGTKFTISLDQS